MEPKKLILLAIIAFAVYQLFIKEKFAFMRQNDNGTTGGTLSTDTKDVPMPTSHVRMRYGGFCGFEGGPPCDQHVHTRNTPQHIEGFSHNNQRGAMNFAHSSHVMNHIRSNRKNSMLNGMMYGNRHVDECQLYGGC